MKKHERSYAYDKKRNSTVIHQPGDVKTDYKDYAHTVRSHLIFLPLSHPFGEGAIFMHKHIIRLRPRNQGFRDPSLTSSSAFVRTKALLVISFRGRKTESVLQEQTKKRSVALVRRFFISKTIQGGFIP